MSETEQATIDLLGTTIEYDVRTSDRAQNPRIDVDTRGVTVVVPAGEEIDPRDLLTENAAWVVEKRDEYQAYRDRAPDRVFEEGETFPYLGTERELVIEPAQRHALEEDRIRLRQSAVEQSTVERVLENFYRERAREHFTSRADHFADRMDVDYVKIELRNQRTRWGSCSTTGTLSLNWRVIMAPPDVVDYLVVHELAHLVEQDHGDAFWSIVASQLPDYADHAAWLEQHSVDLIFTEEDL